MRRADGVHEHLEEPKNIVIRTPEAPPNEGVACASHSFGRGTAAPSRTHREPDFRFIVH